jgi:hypothetical protein
MTSRPSTDHLQALADTLWAERHVVEHLLYRLTCAKLLLAADERRFVALALDEVERTVGALRRAELERSMAVSVVARAWRVADGELTLRVLASTAPEPWRDVFADHEQAFASLAGEIEAATEANRSLAASGLNRIHETMDLLTGTEQPGTYDAQGRARSAAAGPVRVDAAL